MRISDKNIHQLIIGNRYSLFALVVVKVFLQKGAKIEKVHFSLTVLATSCLLLFFGCKKTPTVSNSNELKRYFELSEEYIVLEGSLGKWDENAVHTLSVVEANKDDWKYWGYYGCLNTQGIGLARSNDLVHWTKESTDAPIINEGRWASVIVSRDTFHMFYTKNYGGDSYIVRAISKNGLNFAETEVVVSKIANSWSQNPFIWKNPNDNKFYLLWYHKNGIIRAIYVRTSTTLEDLDEINSTTSLRLSVPDPFLAAPSIIYHDNLYYLTGEVFVGGIYIWQTKAWYSSEATAGFKEVGNNPILANNDACNFQHIFSNTLYNYYSHQDSTGCWDMRLRISDF